MCHWDESEMTIEPNISLDVVIKRLQSAKKLGWKYYCVFNGVELHSEDS